MIADSKRLIRNSVVGIALGGFFGATGMLRSKLDDPVDYHSLNIWTGLLFGAAVGLIAGAIFYRTRSWRQKNSQTYILSWILSLTSGSLLVGIVTILLTTNDQPVWFLLLLFLGLGVVGGYGLAKVTASTFGPDRRR